jgi:hypothetical protein
MERAKCKRFILLRNFSEDQLPSIVADTVVVAVIDSVRPMRPMRLIGLMGRHLKPHLEFLLRCRSTAAVGRLFRNFSEDQLPSIVAVTVVVAAIDSVGPMRPMRLIGQVSRG